VVIYLSPARFLFCGYGASPPYQLGEQGLCQAHNKLIFLAFSVFDELVPIRIGTNLTGLLFRDGTL
jgi:hypothetical protein